MTKLYALINKMAVKPGKRDDVINILIESGKAFDDNPSCILYLIYKDKKDPNVIWIEDVWTSKDNHAAAMSTPQMRAYIDESLPLLVKMPEQIEIVFAGGKGL